MSYADTQLDLSCVPVACLAGANGAGKSALLDAATWAIWEAARSGSDELIRLGESEMWVDVRFEHEGGFYRIRRSRQKQTSKSGSRGQSKGTLDLQVRQDESQAWKSLTGSSIRDTQRLICELLRMDYDTFVNSAYLKQGRADEFTTRTAKERKEVLAEILGLSYFDRLQDHCKEQIRTLKNKKEWLEQSLAELPQTEAQLADREQEHSDKELKLKSSLKEKLEREKILSELSNKLKDLTLVKHKIETGENQLRRDNEDIVMLSDQLALDEDRLAALNELVANQARIEKEAAAFEDLRTQVAQLDNSALALQDFTKNKIEARAELSNLRNRLELEYNQSKDRLKEAEAKREKLLSDTRDSARLSQQYREFKELAGKEESLSQKRETFSQLGDRCAQLERLIDESRVRMEADLSQRVATLAELESLLSSGVSLDHQKGALEQEIIALDKLETELELTRERGQEAKSQIESKQLKIEHLKQVAGEYREKIKELEECADSSACPLCASPIVDRAAVIARYRRSIEITDADITRLEHESSEQDRRRQELRRQYKELDERLKGRKRLDIQIGQFNEKLAALKRAEDNKNKIVEELKSLKQKLDESDYAQVERESLIALKRELQELDFDPVFYNNLQGQIRLERSIEPRYHQLMRDLDELAKTEKQLPALKAAFAELSETLAEESYGNEFRTMLQESERQIGELNYDSTKHSALKTKLSELLPFNDKFNDLKRALKDRPALEASHKNTQSRLTAKREQVANLESNLQTWLTEIGELPSLEDQFKQSEASAEEATLVYDSLTKELAVLEAQKKQLKDKIEEMEARRKQVKELDLSVKDYSILAEAFGKKGIQAVIIENAIPELEADANRLLSRLSDNRMHVGLVTQQTNKSGNVVETLEILIADEIGTRSYELYSGGEAFKVNFAIRVALSRLLARRAGAKLETLIIDEGFGSQDDLSRERLVKAIRSIQEDFARILVITHFSDVKEMFPTHILVSKNNGTSRVEMLN